MAVILIHSRVVSELERRGEERRGESQFYLFVISDESDGLQSYCGQIVGEDSRTIR